MNGGSALACAGCGTAAADARQEPYPFRCTRASEPDDIDHVIRRLLDRSESAVEHFADANPFVRYRRFLHSYHVALGHGLQDADYCGLARRFDAQVAAVAGHGFTVTPLVRNAELEANLGMEAPGSIWIKNETGSVAGSHKARHLAGIMLYLQVIDALGIDRPRERGLAIASCGNAALAAATLARAAGYSLRVFVPAAADAGVIDRIRALGAHIEVCPRRPAERGDPSYLRFQRAVSDGALSFCCQGPANGLTIEGGGTLWLEALEALSSVPLDRVFVQVGGGALASSCVQAIDELHERNQLPRVPRLHAVQTTGAFPLQRAYERVIERTRSGATVDAAMAYARAHRSRFMWPWESEPAGLAHGILDDETYDWAAVVEGLLRSDGGTIVVGEDEVKAANAAARRTTGIDVDYTGSSGLAGLMQVLRKHPAARGEQLLVVFSGRVQRAEPGSPAAR